MNKDFLLISSFFIFPIIVFLINLYISIFTKIYIIHPSIDIPLHFLGGASVAFMFILFLRFFEEKGQILVKNKLIYFILITSLVSFVAVLWEFWEFLMKSLFNLPWQLGLKDTLLDLGIGILGGIFGSWVFEKI